MAGQFIQLGQVPTATGTAADGYGEFVTVQDLDRRERARIRERLEQMRPELIAKGIEVVKAKALADAAAEALRVELHATVGGDGIVAAMAIIHEGVAKQAAEAAKAKVTQPQVQTNQAKK
jgi:hypothetical protein